MSSTLYLDFLIGSEKKSIEDAFATYLTVVLFPIDLQYLCSLFVCGQNLTNTKRNDRHAWGTYTVTTVLTPASDGTKLRIFSYCKNALIIQE